MIDVLNVIYGAIGVFLGFFLGKWYEHDVVAASLRKKVDDTCSEILEEVRR